VNLLWLVQASLIGMQRRMAVSTRSCGICGDSLMDFGAVVSAREEAAGAAEVQAGGEETVQLGCKHCFHADCIRGWTIVGKKVCFAQDWQQHGPTFLHEVRLQDCSCH